MKRQTTDAELFDNMFDDPFGLVPVDLRHLIPGFLERREKETHELVELLRTKDFSGIKDIGHKLKGTGAGYGFQLISDLGQELEIAANTADEKKVRHAIEQLSMITSNLKGILSIHNNS